MKCQTLFSGKNKKNIINLPSTENAHRVVKVKVFSISVCESTSEMHHGRLIWVYLWDTGWWLSKGLAWSYINGQIRTFSVSEKGKSHRGLDLVRVARRLPPQTSEIALQFQMHVLEHYYTEDKHAEILSLDVFSNISCAFLVQRHGNTEQWHFCPSAPKLVWLYHHMRRI